MQLPSIPDEDYGHPSKDLCQLPCCLVRRRSTEANDVWLTTNSSSMNMYLMLQRFEVKPIQGLPTTNRKSQEAISPASVYEYGRYFCECNCFKWSPRSRERAYTKNDFLVPVVPTTIMRKGLLLTLFKRQETTSNIWLWWVLICSSNTTGILPPFDTVPLARRFGPQRETELSRNTLGLPKPVFGCSRGWEFSLGLTPASLF